MKMDQSCCQFCRRHPHTMLARWLPNLLSTAAHNNAKRQGHQKGSFSVPLAQAATTVLLSTPVCITITDSKTTHCHHHAVSQAPCKPIAAKCKHRQSAQANQPEAPPAAGTLRLHAVHRGGSTTRGTRAHHGRLQDAATLAGSTCCCIPTSAQ